MSGGWTESDYRAAGYVRFTVRMAAEEGEAVRELAKRTGQKIGPMLAGLAQKELAKLKNKNRRGGVK